MCFFHLWAWFPYFCWKKWSTSSFLQKKCLFFWEKMMYLIFVPKEMRMSSIFFWRNNEVQSGPRLLGKDCWWLVSIESGRVISSEKIKHFIISSKKNEFFCWRNQQAHKHFSPVILVSVFLLKKIKCIIISSEKNAYFYL